jgi:putative resolvase
MGMREEKLYSTGKTAKMPGIHFVTLKKWIYAGKVKAIKTPGGSTAFQKARYGSCSGSLHQKNRAIIYARVSSADQKEDLKRQKQMLQEYTKQHGYEIVATFEDVASGLKDDRRAEKVFEALRAGQADVIVVAWKDSLTRFGFRYLENHAGDLGARIEVVNEQEEKAPQQELVEDLLSIVTSFAGRLYGMRSSKTKVLEVVRLAIS